MKNIANYLSISRAIMSIILAISEIFSVIQDGHYIRTKKCAEDFDSTNK